jgi:hypothetical protein
MGLVFPEGVTHRSLSPNNNGSHERPTQGESQEMIYAGLHGDMQNLGIKSPKDNTRKFYGTDLFGLWTARRDLQLMGHVKPWLINGEHPPTKGNPHQAGASRAGAETECWGRCKAYATVRTRVDGKPREASRND